MSYSVVVFADSETDFDNCKKRLSGKDILFCNSQTTSRLSFLKNHTARWLLFIDADCELETKFTQQLEQEVPNLKKDSVYAGIYLNPQGATYLQKAHNFIANTWLKVSYADQNRKKRLLGGAFLIYTDQEKLNKIQDDQSKLFWGAEDKLLSQQLASAGYSFQLEQKFQVIHRTSKSIKHFIRRAWLQGYNDNLRENSNDENLKIKYWLFRLAPTNLWLAPAVLLHFLILRSGILFQKVRPPHSLK